MQFISITEEQLQELIPLHVAYKSEIGEESPSQKSLDGLAKAIVDGRILFFGCVLENQLVACCSVSVVYSTFCYDKSGVFEDFYILPQHRHKGIARKLAAFAFDESGVASMTVGCADCDRTMYRSIGFDIPLGNMLAYVKQ